MLLLIKLFVSTFFPSISVIAAKISFSWNTNDLNYSPSFSLFAQILDIVEQRREASSSAVFTFLKAVLAEKVPGPGTR
jgi:hypothetical protein